jgi:peroxiredoxin Q/BCP
MPQSPAEGAPAPEFNLPRDGGGSVSLADFNGRKLVLFFYPKADTSGCTIEAKDFSRLNAEFAKAGVAVIGVSADPVKKQDAFKAKHDLATPLASDGPTACSRPMGCGARNPCTGASSWASPAPRC